MKITTKGRYGLTLMLELARNYGGGPISLKTIATNNDLSDAYLEQLATLLRKASLIKSVRGAYGGYTLGKHPQNISAGEIIRVLEGPIALVENIENEDAAKQVLWLKMTAAIRDVLNTTSLDDLLVSTDESKQEAYMFYI